MNIQRHGAFATLVALFADEEALSRAIERLETLGLSSDEVSIVSNVPYPEQSFHKRRAKDVPLQWVSLTGGILGAVLGFTVAGGTALLYQIPTGHMDIVALPPIAIITYELMMLGVILSTLGGLLYGLRFRARASHALDLHDDRIGEGYLAILLSGNEERLGHARSIFEEMGAEELQVEKRA